jgi:Tol biopolymer transport system component
LAAAVVVWSLQRTGDVWRDPLAGATVARLTDFEGHHAAISRDGKFVAFLSDRDGPWDAWVSQVGTGDIYNRTNGSVPELRNPATRTLGFTPDGTLVTLWRRVPDSARGGLVNAGWAVPTLGGPLRPYLKDIADISELDWSPDGSLIVYHPPADGDPLFVSAPEENSVRRTIYQARKGFHNHFPVWSHDGAFIYFVHGLPLEKNDLWRIRTTGDQLERLTFHDSRVTFPVLLTDRMLLYLATDDEGYGPWLYAMDLEHRVPHRIFTGIDSLTSLAASADGRRLVATVTRSTAGLWRIPIADRVTGESEARPVSLPTAGGLSPRLQPGSVIYRGEKAGKDGLWKLADGGAATELWNGINGRVIAGPAIARDGRLAFLVQRRGRTELYVSSVDGSASRRLAEELDVRGAPAWSPDGRRGGQYGWGAATVQNPGRRRAAGVAREGIRDRPRVGSERDISPLLGCGRRHDIFDQGGDRRRRTRPSTEPDPHARRQAPGISRRGLGDHHEGRHLAQGLLVFRSQDRSRAPTDEPRSRFDDRGLRYIPGRS